MAGNDVFNILWDPRRTHQELVKQSNQIFKELARQQLLKDDLMGAFWHLGSDNSYKDAVFKILKETTDLDKDQLLGVIRRMELTPTQNIGHQELETLAGNMKFNTNEDLRKRSFDFFWRILCDPASYKPETVESCIEKFQDFQRRHTHEEIEQYWRFFAD